jgi:ribosomal protein L11 methyltransferase
MSYLELEFSFDITGLDPEILMAYLGELGFESFAQHEQGITAYIQKPDFNEASLQELLTSTFDQRGIDYTVKEMPDENWNAVWESNFPPVEVAGRCRVRAPFHEPDPSFPLELVIEPKMSFGTAHHETTSLVMELLLDNPPAGLDVLDMGSGTGILAILAAKLGATHVVAIDNDDWAFQNAIENTVHNDEAGIEVKLGDAAILGSESYDLILANINRNILLNDIPTYCANLRPGGQLIMSGFYESDLEMILIATNKCGLYPGRYITRNDWVAATFLSPKA